MKSCRVFVAVIAAGLVACGGGTMGMMDGSSSDVVRSDVANDLALDAPVDHADVAIDLGMDAESDATADAVDANDACADGCVSDETDAADVPADVANDAETDTADDVATDTTPLCPSDQCVVGTSTCTVGACCPTAPGSACGTCMTVCTPVGCAPGECVVGGSVSCPLGQICCEGGSAPGCGTCADSCGGVDAGPADTGITDTGVTDVVCPPACNTSGHSCSFGGCCPPSSTNPCFHCSPVCML